MHSIDYFLILIDPSFAMDRENDTRLAKRLFIEWTW